MAAMGAVELSPSMKLGQWQLGILGVQGRRMLLCLCAVQLLLNLVGPCCVPWFNSIAPKAGGDTRRKKKTCCQEREGGKKTPHPKPPESLKFWSAFEFPPALLGVIA